MAAKLSAAATASLSAAEQAAAAKPVAKRPAMGWLRSLVNHSPDMASSSASLHTQSPRASPWPTASSSGQRSWGGWATCAGVAWPELEQLAELVCAVPTMRHNAMAVALLGNPRCDLRDTRPSADTPARAQAGDAAEGPSQPTHPPTAHPEQAAVTDQPTNEQYTHEQAPRATY